jgi:chromosome partitioning protein
LSGYSVELAKAAYAKSDRGRPAAMCRLGGRNVFLIVTKEQTTAFYLLGQHFVNMHV